VADGGSTHERGLESASPPSHIADLDRPLGLASRKELSNAVHQSVANGGHPALLLLDVDRFRTVNESLGHSAGDEVLAVVAERLRTWVEPNVVVARIGDDEFALVMASSFDEQLVMTYGEHLVALLGAPMLVGAEAVRITVSVGVAFSRVGQTSGESLLWDASVALAPAKRLCGNRCDLLDATQQESAISRARLETDLRKALDARDLSVCFQPIVRLDGTIVSVEALARWSHPVLGAVPPSDFVPLAEEAGLITALGTQVTEMASLHVARWRRTLAPSLKLSLNTSASQLTEHRAAETIMGALAASDLEPSAVCLELTETAFLEDEEHAVRALADLHSQGMEIAVDDFGTGYCSLLYLDRFPVHFLKVDRYFIARLGHDRAVPGIVDAIVQLAHLLGLVAVAEGVETPEQLEALLEIGCDLGQGYYWSPPLPADDMEALLELRAERAG